MFTMSWAGRHRGQKQGQEAQGAQGERVGADLLRVQEQEDKQLSLKTNMGQQKQSAVCALRLMLARTSLTRAEAAPAEANCKAGGQREQDLEQLDTGAENEAGGLLVGDQNQGEVSAPKIAKLPDHLIDFHLLCADPHPAPAHLHVQVRHQVCVHQEAWWYESVPS